ncbi:MAG: type III pantothenate kinase [Balneolales bacterium]
MNTLYIDIGNSRTKIAVYKEQEWEIIRIIDRSHGADLIKLVEQNHSQYNEIQVSSVLKAVADDLTVACPADKLRMFTNKKIPHDRISYDDHDTLGVDRFLAATGAWSQNHKACIVVDAGTACTIDYVDQKGVFRGGVIMPGLKSIEGELVNSAGALPPVERIIPDEWPPKSTKTGLQWGIFGSYIAAIEAHMNRLLKHNGNVETWLTGGDAELIKPLLSSEVIWDENLVFYGLRHMTGEH